MIARISSFLMGLGILVASAWAAIVHTAADDAQALLILAMIGGLAVGAVMISRASGAMRWALAVLLVCGELSAAALTFERTIESRSIAGAQARAQAAARSQAAGDVAEAKAALEAAQQAMRDQAALKGCAANCRELLQSDIDAARDVVTAKEQAFAALPVPVDVEDLASVTGFAAWQLSAVLALLASLASNGLGAVLVASSVHGVAPKVVERRVLDMDWEPKLKVAEQPNTVHTFQPLPPKPMKKRRKQFPANVVNLESHKVFRALRKVSKPVSNSELAHLLSETEGEASKSWREIADHLDVHREGRELRIALRA